MTKHLLPPVYTLAAADVAELTRSQRQADGVRVFRGGYVSRSVELTLPLTVRAALQVLPEGALASHSTAGALLGAPVGAGLPLDFTVRPGTYRARRLGLRIHVRSLGAGDEIRLDGLPTTSGAQTWLDLAAVLADDELVAVGDALWRLGHLDAEILAERLARANGARGVVRARACAPLLSPLAMSRPESLLRYWLLTSPLPDPQPQVAIHDRWGRVVAHGDLGYPEWRVLLEYEGRQHADHEQFGRDVDRYSLMGADGWLVLRFAGRHITGPTVVVERTRRALLSRGWRPGAD
ncbi:MAG: hypothetical protein ACJ715_06460 [Ornithinibacter sp.]